MDEAGGSAQLLGSQEASRARRAAGWPLAPVFHVILVQVVANFSVALASIGLLNPLIRPPELRALQNAVYAGGWPLILDYAVSTAITGIFGLWLAWPLVRARRRPGDQAALARARRTSLQEPLYQALLAFPAWAAGHGFFHLVAFLRGIPVEPQWLFALILRNQMCALLVFCIVHYWLQAIVRRVYVPELFPGGRVSEQLWVSPLSVRTRFFIFYAGICVVPTLLFYSIVIAQMTPQQRAPFEGLLNATLVGMLAVGAWLTFIVSTGYQRPLVAMKRALLRVREGDYATRVAVTSDDELGALGDGFNDMAAGLREREEIRATFGRLVDPSVRDHLLRGDLRLGGEIRAAAVLFVDIRGFTTLSEKMSPEEVVRMLNHYFDLLGGCITAEKGVLNKYIGDAMMAVFGAPLALERPAESALRAAVRMRDSMGELNGILAREGLPTLKTGVGVHAGPVLAGTIGSTQRMEYTVIGDTVNLASRVEGLCKELSCDLLLTESVKDGLGAGAADLAARTVLVATTAVRGREEATRLYTIRPE